ncbi:MAG: GGDEF domain-containing protein [Candidatus Micrarchaeaceae archaeon]
MNNKVQNPTKIINFKMFKEALELKRSGEIINIEEAKSVLRKIPNGIKIYKKSIQDENKELKSINKKLEEENKKLKNINKKLREISLTDELTGLGNRKAYEEDTQRIFSWYLRKLEECKKNVTNMPINIGLVVIDGNGLKKINDTLNHKFGDQAICRIATAIKVTKRMEDYAYRKGNGADEFVVILISNKNSSQKFINRLKNELKIVNFEQNVNIGLDNRFNVTFSAGAANLNEVINNKLVGYTPKKLESMLFNLAEKRMYSEKREVKR